MLQYKDILIENYSTQEFDMHVGVFIYNGSWQLAGEAILKKKKNSIYADITATMNLDDYFIQAKSLANKIDQLILSRTSKNGVKKIGEQAGKAGSECHASNYSGQ